MCWWIYGSPVFKSNFLAYNFSFSSHFLEIENDGLPDSMWGEVFTGLVYGQCDGILICYSFVGVDSCGSCEQKEIIHGRLLDWNLYQNSSLWNS